MVAGTDSQQTECEQGDNDDMLSDDDDREDGEMKYDEVTDDDSENTTQEMEVSCGK